MAKKKQKDRFSNSINIRNKRARFEYEVIETFEAGLALTGNEVKSLREGRASLADVYAQPRGVNLVIKNMHINPYEEGNAETNPMRDRQLLLHRKEIDRLAGAVSQQGLSIIPLKVYFNDKGFAKVLVGLCRGKKTHDKRETIKQRDMDREMRRSYKVR
jgi:SsrA-binding protein